MFLVGWLLAGILLGWIVSSEYRGWRDSPQQDARNQPSGSAAQQVSVSPNTAAAVLALLAEYGFDSNKLLERARRDATGFAAKRPSSRLIFAVVLLLALVAFASATDHAALSNGLLVIKSIFVGARVQALIIGIVVGFFAERQKVLIGSAARRIGKAVIGDKDNTAWALQGAVALALVAAAVFAIRPDFLDYLRSFKVGTFEATFADRQPSALRDAHLNLRDFREHLALEQYRNFRAVFLSDKVARGWARQLTMDPALQKETGEITAELFVYVGPIINSVLCLQEANALRTAIRDYDLIAYAVIWENFLLRLHADKRIANADEIATILKGLKARSSSIVSKTNDLNPGCVEAKNREDDKLGRQEETSNPAADIAGHFATAASILDKIGYNKSEVLALTILEPYLTGAVADLISLISGDREKTDFLIKMLDGFPLSDDLVSPGMVNLFYQVTDSWLNGTGPLPLDNVRATIEYAARGADLTMARSAKRLAELDALAGSKQAATATSSGRDGQGNRSSGAENVRQSKDDPLNDSLKVTEVFDTFLRNSFAILTDETDIYVQRALEGENVSDSHRQSWIRAVSRLSALLQVKLGAPTIDLDGVPRTEVDEFTKERLRAGKPIDADFMLQADLAVALSSVLLNGGKEASAQACNTALFYINDSGEWVEPTKTGNRLDSAQEQRLRQLITAVAARTGESCSWIDHRG